MRLFLVGHKSEKSLSLLQWTELRSSDYLLTPGALLALAIESD